MSTARGKAPDGWGDDALTDYFDNFRNNQYATFDNKRPQVSALIRIDALFKRFLDGAINPQPLEPMGFLLRAHAAYRAAANAIFAGQVFEAQTLLRLCLENGAYSTYVGTNVERWKLWMARHDDPEAKPKLRRELSHGNIRNHIQEISQPLGEQFSILYEELIDFGAHPNEKGFSLNSAIQETSDRVDFQTIYLHGDGLALNFGLQTTKQVGLWVLHIAQLIYPTRFSLLGIKDELEKLREPL